MRGITLFADGPFESLEVQSRRVIGLTDVQRLLRWGTTPLPSNEHNADHLLEAVRSLPSEGRWYGMKPARIRHLKGWPEGLEIAKRYTAQLPSFTVEDVKRRRVWDVAGDEFDRDRFDANIEECWMTRRRTKVPARPVLKLTCAVGGSARRGADELVWMGAAAFALCDAAERAGYRVEIEAISQTYETWDNDRRECVQRIKVKSANEPLDRETTVMAMACPAFFRWHIIRSRCAISPDLEMQGGSGITQDIDPDLRGDLHMPHAYDFYEAKRAVGELVSQIEAMASGMTVQ
ncbi:MAG: hypothetical protein ACM359_02960 [Bacillota bacterium]